MDREDWRAGRRERRLWGRLKRAGEAAYRLKREAELQRLWAVVEETRKWEEREAHWLGRKKQLELVMHCNLHSTSGSPMTTTPRKVGTKPVDELEATGISALGTLHVLVHKLICGHVLFFRHYNSLTSRRPGSARLPHSVQCWFAWCLNMISWKISNLPAAQLTSQLFKHWSYG